MPQTASLGIIDAAITNRSESPMQYTKSKAKLHFALPPLSCQAINPTPCSDHQNNAQSPMQDTKIKAKPHSALLPHPLTAHRATNNQCHARATKTLPGSTDANTKTTPKAKQHSALSPHRLPGHKPMQCSGHQNYISF